MTPEPLCDCGQPLHYASEESQRVVQMLVDDLGPTIVLETPSGCWAIPRHYIALHGIKAEDVPALAALYGWAKVPPPVDPGFFQ